MTTAIIGAGVAGLSAARALQAAGERVLLYDKGRGPGGRMSTRRAQTPLGEVRWDHGAQFFTARDEAFRNEVVRLREAGAAACWRPRLADIRKRGDGWTVGVRPADNDRTPVHVGTPSMNAVIKTMADGLEVLRGRRVTLISAGGGPKWLDFGDRSREGPFDRVISAVPAEQAATLLAGASDKLADEAGQARSAPCWAVMLAFHERVPVSWDVAQVSGAGLALAARNSSKPGRDTVESWVLHATPEWSRANIDMAADEVAHELTAEFEALSGAPAPAFAAAHRWLYAKVEQAAGSRFGWDERAGIGVVGDWRSGPRVEAAWLSGQACAEFLAGIVQTT